MSLRIISRLHRLMKSQCCTRRSTLKGTLSCDSSHRLLSTETIAPKVFADDNFAQVVSNAEKIVGYPTSFMSLRCLLSDEMNTVAMYIRKLVGTKHPLLKIARGLVFNGRYGMQTRGLIVLLLAKAASEWSEDSLDSEVVSGIHNKQRQLAEIIETIHLANLIHQGIVNLRDLEPGENGLKDMEFGNKITVLTGDFLLANACTNLAKLENPKVVELVSESISRMMESNFVYLDTGEDTVTLDQWREFTFLSRGALLASCCRCSLMVASPGTEKRAKENEASSQSSDEASSQSSDEASSQSSDEASSQRSDEASSQSSDEASSQSSDEASRQQTLQQAAYDYGRYLSFAHQIREDLRPFLDSVTSEPLNRKSLPVLHYLHQTGRDVTDDNQVRLAVMSSSSLAYCRDQCREYGLQASDALSHFPDSPSRAALRDIVNALTDFPS